MNSGESKYRPERGKVLSWCPGVRIKLIYSPNKLNASLLPIREQPSLVIKHQFKWMYEIGAGCSSPTCHVICQTQQQWGNRWQVTIISVTLGLE